MKTNTVPIGLAKEILSYNAETGIFTWKWNKGNARLGAVAGSVALNGYIVIGIKTRHYYAHRLAWLLHHGQWPSKQIDHINRNPADNRICNLREADYWGNACNKPAQKNNKCGYKGVSITRHGRFTATIAIHGRRIRLGNFSNPELAHAAYAAAASDLHGQFATTK